MLKNIRPNEITFGIMVKIYGFSRELHKAFDLLELMEVFKIQISIIIFTNLIHISFYNRKPRKAELAFALFRKTKQKTDRLLYSKLIDGLIRFREIKKVPKYINYALKDKVPLKPETIKSILKYFKSPEIIQKLNKLKSYNKNYRKMSKKHRVNNYNIENPKKYKKMIQEKKKNHMSSKQNN